MILSSKDGAVRRAPRRLRRGALPSSLIGLVTFSFTVLAFSTVAYTTSLPALIQAAQRADDDSLFYKALAGLTQGDAQGAGADAGAAASGDAAASAGDAGSGSGSGKRPARGSITLGGASLQGIISNIAGNSVEKPQAPDAGAKPDVDPKPEGGSEPDGGTGGQPGGGTTGGGGTDGGGGSTDGDSGNQGGGKPEASPEEEERMYNFLAERLALIDSYLVRVNAATSGFNNDCLGAYDVRAAHRAECMALWEELLLEFDTVVNKAPAYSGTQYVKPRGRIIAMYRLLRDYIGVLCEAWDINVPLPDPSSSIDAFMAPIRLYEKDGENIFLAEFKQIYEGFVL